MPRRRSSNTGGRGANRTARRFQSTAPPPSSFDETWLRQYSERSRNRYVDLTRVEDRRFWSPKSVNKLRARTVLGLGTRIVVVPEGHGLARFQTYGGRYSLDEVRKRGLKHFTYHNAWVNPQDHPYGEINAKRWRTVSKRVGFHAPWQVIICVRRKRRREVLHALNKTGAGKGRQRRPVRNTFSEVRC